MYANFRIFIILVLLLGVGFCHGQVVVNEFMASNESTISDEQGEYDDWFELYNTTSTTFVLGGMYLTDDLLNLTKWIIPQGTEITPNGFLLIWADREEGDGPLHTNFKLDADGEQVCLVSSDGTTVLDYMVFGRQISDISCGRYPDGTENWYYFTDSSPGTANNSSEYAGIASDPLFSNAAGFYESNLLLEISPGATGGTIYYTRDGSTPSLNDIPYTSPFSIFPAGDSIEVIKARAFKADYLPSRTMTQTYFLNQNFNLPVVSLSTDPDNFFDDEIGIYVLGNEADESFPYRGANFWSDCPHSNMREYNCENWERPVHIEFFEPDGEFGFGADVGARIHGHWMRGLPQKTLAIIARGEYGYTEINYPIFPNLSTNEFQGILLRSSGNDWSSSMIRDGLAATLGARRDLDIMAFRPSILFINGAYWGIHNIREKINEHYVRSHHDVNLENLDLIENTYGTWPIYGTIDKYNEMKNFLNRNDMSLNVNYQKAADMIDIDELISYTVIELYANNWDWIGGNCKRWHAPGRKWRWILNDLDAAFNQYPGQMRPPEENMFDNNSLKGFTEYRELIENEQFRNKFINSFADNLNTIFIPEYFINIVDSLRAIIESEMPKHVERWKNTFIPGVSWIGDGINSMEEWHYELERLYDFATIRESHTWDFIKDEFGLNGFLNLEFTGNNTRGYIRLNTIFLRDFPWQGKYFIGVPIEFEAYPKKNYAFSHWLIEGETSYENPIAITPTETVSIRVFFNESPGSGSPDNTIVINEINYNSEDNFNPGDWIELYNNSESTINISNWKFMDEDNAHIYSFPSNIQIATDEYLVLCRDTVQFKSLFPNIENYIGNMGFGLSGGGEFIRLLDIAGQNPFVDSLTYDDQSPWPKEPDGDGPTLALKNPDLDNSVAENWDASSGHGTPGKINDVLIGIVLTENDDIIPENFIVYQNYPNPFNDKAIIKYAIAEEAEVIITVYNTLGQNIKTLKSEIQQPGYYSVIWDGSKRNGQSASSGIYYYQLQVNKGKTAFSDTKKMVLMK